MTPVAIQCSSAKHDGRVVKIDTFRKTPSDEDASRVQWIGDHAQYTTHNAATQKHLSTWSSRVEDDGLSSYYVHRLRCNLCPRSVPARRERFWLALEELSARHGAEPVELSLLGAIVSKQ